ncbi:MAG: RsmD family RNA methyltransferase [Acidimicrobiales bacterium]
MRVVAGVAGGRRLEAPPGRRLRPTTERVREAVFSSLASLGVLDGAVVLDLFAGTGAMGIEALSRGASSVTFVEADPGAVAVIRANLAATGLAGGTVAHADVGRFLDRGPSPADLVFCDPPYAFTAWEALLARLPGDLAVLESRRAVEPGPGWEVVRTGRYGDTTVTTARRAGPTAAGPAAGPTGGTVDAGHDRMQQARREQARRWQSP